VTPRPLPWPFWLPYGLFCFAYQPLERWQQWCKEANKLCWLNPNKATTRATRYDYPASPARDCSANRPLPSQPAAICWFCASCCQPAPNSASNYAELCCLRVRLEWSVIVHVKPVHSSDQQAAHPRALIVSSRHEYASARNQDVALRQDRIAAPEKKRKPGVKPGAGPWGNPSNTQATHLPVVGSVVDPSLELGRHVAI